MAHPLYDDIQWILIVELISSHTRVVGFTIWNHEIKNSEANASKAETQRIEGPRNRQQITAAAQIIATFHVNTEKIPMKQFLFLVTIHELGGKKNFQCVCVVSART